MDMDDDGSTTVYEQYAFLFLYICAGATVSIAAVSWAFSLSTHLRLREHKRGERVPAKTSAIYTLVSIAREVAYAQLSIPGIGTLPNTGTLLFFGGYTIILLSCLLSDVWAPIPTFWEAIAMRAAYLSVAQLPLLILLSTKKNVIAYIFNSSHERLIIYHQFLGICLLMTTSLHMGYFVKEWLYYDVWKSQWETMGQSMLRWGFAAWGLLLLTVITSITFFRARLYDAWIILHLAVMLAFFVMVILHLDPPYRIWAYIPLAFWVFDRAWRFTGRLWLNASARDASLFRASALVESLQGDVVRLTILNFPMKRRAGQYIYLSLYKLGIHSHPFTIVSDAKSDNITLLVKAKQGLTRRLLLAGSTELPPQRLSLQCSIEGPYGGAQTKFQAFESAVFISGGSGGTFTINLLQDLLGNPGCCRKIAYIWAIRAECHVAWFSKILTECSGLARQNGLDLSIDIYITQDAKLTMEEPSQAGPACRSSKCRCQSKDISEARESLSSSQSSTSSVNQSLLKKSQCCCTGRELSEKSTPWELHVGRPNLYTDITQIVREAQGETGIAVCGPLCLSQKVRNTVARIGDERAVKKGSGAEAIYLHVENQF